MGIEIADDGTLVEAGAAPRVTATLGYPLPPLAQGRFVPTWNRWKQYTLPNPTTGAPTSYARATTVASTLEDTYRLNRWKMRGAVGAVITFLEHTGHIANGEYNRDVAERLARCNANADDLLAALLYGDFDGPEANDVIDLISDVCGGRAAAELGQAVHEWLAAVDMALIRPAEVPEVFAPYLTAYRRVLARHGLAPVPEFVERIVYNDTGPEVIVGTLDRLYRVVTTGELVLGDLKTSKTLEHNLLGYTTQLTVYHRAKLMLAADGSRWETMPPLSEHPGAAYLIHLPSDNPGAAACVPLSMWFGDTLLNTACNARQLRRRVVHDAPLAFGEGMLVSPTPEALAWCEARDAVLDITDPEKLGVIWEQYQHVWTDELTTLGYRMAELIENNTEDKGVKT